MSRKLPLCAACGERLRGAQWRCEFAALPGKPIIGWHWEEGRNCRGPDVLLYAELRLARNADERMALLREIEARGPGRLSVTREWQQPTGDNDGYLQRH